MADTIDKSTLIWVSGLIFAAITTTATGIHILHEQYITPIKIFDLTRQVETLTAKLDSQSDMANQLKTTQEKLEQAKSKLAQVEYSELFLKNDPYPATLNIVRLGQNISKIYETYGKEEIVFSNDIPDVPRLIVEIKNSVFNEVRYSYDPKTNIIMSVSFSLDLAKPLGKDFLRESLTKALGDPIASEMKNQYMWSLPKVADAYLILNHYMLMDKRIAPAVWVGDRKK